jgi:hypothetical protein
VILAALERGIDIPLEVADRQGEVLEVCFPFWEGFVTLSRRRPWYGGGMGASYPGYIPYSEASQYAKDHFYTDVAELDLFVYIIDGLDEVYIEHMRKVAATKTPKK